MESMADNEPDDTTVAIVNHSDAPAQPRPTATLLPAPLASLVSLVASTSAFGFRVGGYIGNAAIRSARVGTLTGFELGRVVLEGILSRAGQDVVTSSAGALGRTAAESMLERALSTLHVAITSGSFLASTGFQIGSTSLTSGVGIAQYFLSALDAIFGDTESSKAIATIIVLIQRESRNPETGAKGERLTLADFIVGSVAFGLLQRWGRERTAEEFLETGGEQTIWDIVVIDQGRRVSNLPIIETGLHDPEDARDDQRATEAAPYSLPRPTSFVSANDHSQTLDGFEADDGTSFISRASSRPPSAGRDQTRPEQAFQHHLMDQLQPGSQIRISAQSVTTNSVTVEVVGDSATELHPPIGYSLVSSESVESPQGSNTRRFVFSNRQRRLRHGSFEVDELQELRRRHSVYDAGAEELPSFDFPNTEAPKRSLSLPTEEMTGEVAEESKARQDVEPVAANQSRARAPPQSDQSAAGLIPSLGAQRSPAKHKKSSLRNTLRRHTSYKNLVDFWRDRDRFPRAQPSSSGNTANHGPDVTLPQTTSPFGDAYSAAAFAHNSLRRPNFDDGAFRSATQPDRFERRQSYQRHKRGASSIYTMTETTSETSLVLHDAPNFADGDRIISLLQRDGSLSEVYPRAPLVSNLARFARFASAAYGERFLRLTGSITGDAPEPPVNEDRLAHRAEHRSFSTYINLPTSAVLLSSYVDPQGGTDATGQTETGMPLIHYVSIDHQSKAVVLTCRGTLGFEDVLTDMTCDYAYLQWRGKEYPVHKGMLASARRLLTLHGSRMITTLKVSLDEYPDYGVVICGHSLGGGVAALLGILLSQPVLTSTNGATAFVTTSIPTPKLIQAASINETLSATSNVLIALPANRPIHVYAYGPAACVSAELQQATRGLITTVCNGLDLVPYLSLGNLRDQQAICLAFKTDTQDAKGEIKRRVWEGFLETIKDKTRTRNFFASDWLEAEEQANADDDQWPWAALKSLRAGMTAEKLVPPGEVYTIQSQPVLQRHAFVSRASGGDGSAAPELSARTFKPATHITFSHVRDVAKRFGEIRIGASMFSDHLPGRYDRILRLLEQGVEG